jgi:hypothetical protein
MRREGRGARIAVAISFVVGLLTLSPYTAVLATEPSGSVILEAAWLDEAKTDQNRRLLRLTVRPMIHLEEWRLIVSAPLTFDVHGRAPTVDADFRSVAAEDNRRTISADMRSLERAESLTLEFEVVFPPKGGGTISFTIEDGSPTGRRVLEAVGITARATGPAAVRRLGAAEFSANVLPSTQPR